MIFLLCSRSGLSVSSLVTQKSPGAATPPGALSLVRRAHVYDCLPQALSLETPIWAAPGVITTKWAPGLMPGRGWERGEGVENTRKKVLPVLVRSLKGA